MRRLLLALALAVFPSVAWAQAAQLENSYQEDMNTSLRHSAQLIRCDVSLGIATQDTPRGGETCESGDWSLPLDCREMTTLRVEYYEYGTGDGVAKIWNCQNPVGVGTGTIAAVGTEAPGGAPSASDPDPLCVDITASAGVTLDGLSTGTIFLNVSDQNLEYIIGEIETCTGNCDSTLLASCGH